MVDTTVIKSVKEYLNTVKKNGIPISFGVIYGSQVHGNTNKWSDIDLLVISSRFDKSVKREDISLLWRLCMKTDSRIEPIAVGEDAWREDDSYPLIEIARREGEIVYI
jgi:predicted nucleotidyltransferase